MKKNSIDEITQKLERTTKEKSDLERRISEIDKDFEAEKRKLEAVRRAFIKTMIPEDLGNPAEYSDEQRDRFMNDIKIVLDFIKSDPEYRSAGIETERKTLDYYRELLEAAEQRRPFVWATARPFISTEKPKSYKILIT